MSKSTQVDQCQFSGCTNRFPHQHIAAEGKTAPSVEEFNEATREQWTEEQRRRIAENEAALRQLAEGDPKVRQQSPQPYLPRGNDLTVQEQIAILHGGLAPTQYAATHETLLKREPQGYPLPQAIDTSQTQAEQKIDLEHDDFPDLGAKYGRPPMAEGFENLDPALGTLSKSPAEASCNKRMSTGLPLEGTAQHPSRFQNTHFLNTNPQCTGPCPVHIPHNAGAFLMQGEIPRVWNARWGYSDPPRVIWDAWTRVENGTASEWDKVEVDEFALCHWWAGP